jgi:hypothetical protein
MVRKIIGDRGGTTYVVVAALLEEALLLGFWEQGENLFLREN